MKSITQIQLPNQDSTEYKSKSINSTVFKGTTKKVESVFYLSNQLDFELNQGQANLIEFTS
jgi:hypothetical protein